MTGSLLTWAPASRTQLLPEYSPWVSGLVLYLLPGILTVISFNREFAAAASSNPGSAELSLSKIPKLVSVVNILSHLGTTHPIQLEEAVQEAVQVELEMFTRLLTSFVQASLVSPATPSSTAAIPFLLNLSSLRYIIQEELCILLISTIS